MPVDRGTDKEDVIYTSAMKKNEIMPSAVTQTDLEIAILSEASQTEKEKYCMIMLVCGI